MQLQSYIALDSSIIGAQLIAKDVEENWRGVTEVIVSSTAWRFREKLQKPVSVEGSRTKP